MTKSVRYYKANKKTSEEIRLIMLSWTAVLKEAKELAKSVGADQKSIYTCHDGFCGVRQVSGFTFPSGEIPRGWCRLKGTDDGYKPKSTSPLKKQFDELKVNDIARIKDLLKIDNKLRFERGSITTTRFGCSIVGGLAYIATDSEKTPDGCKRISDVEYEEKVKA